jgi:superfamily II DNA/RNA helicase
MDAAQRGALPLRRCMSRGARLSLRPWRDLRKTEEIMSFDTLGLLPAILKSVLAAGYENPTEVQAQTIPPALEGRDLRVCSNTGSGKTAAFVLPALQRVLNARADPAQRRPKGQAFGPRVLVLTPTRELAIQVAKAAEVYGQDVPGLKIATVVGGVPYGAQLAALRKPLDLLIATPGRLIDHLESGKAILGHVEMLVLDEADRMLDMGFIEDIERIAAALPQSRQTVMVSATFAGQVGRLADQILRDDAQRIEVANHTDSHENIEQQLMWADDLQHKAALLEHLLTERELQQAVIFTSTQRDADELAAHLYDLGHAVAPLHGGMPQGRRNRTLMALRRGELRVLVATDVAARGIDVPNISHVINFGLPMKAEDYVHRIGRTGRAGRSGRAITLAERRDVSMIRRIQQFTTQPIPVGTIEGLEPKRPVPELFTRTPRHMERPGNRPGAHRGAPAHRGHPSAGGPGGFRGEPRWHEGGDDRRRDGHPPRAGGHGPAAHAARGEGHHVPAAHPRAPYRPHGDAPAGHHRRDGAPARGPARPRGPGPR